MPFLHLNLLHLNRTSAFGASRATLPDGTLVAVKVQRPGIVETVTNDLAIMERLAEVPSATPASTSTRSS